MTTLEICLLITSICLLVTTCVSMYFNIKHGLLILKTTDSITRALDLLDERYESISEILQIPLFYDSPQIRQVLDDVEASRNAILRVANYIAVVESETANDIEPIQ